MTVDDYLEAAPEPHATTLRALHAGEDASRWPKRACRTGCRPSGCRAHRSPAPPHAKKGCSYFPHSGSVLSEVDQVRLRGSDWAKGTQRFPVDHVPDESQIRRLVEMRLGQLAE